MDLLYPAAPAAETFGNVLVSRLPSGLRVVSDPMPTVETVSVGLWIGVGTREEVDAQNGVAHLLEHMLFKGTERRSPLDIAAEIEAVGGHLNAYTGRESTAYFCKVLKEDLALALDVIADMTQHSTFDPQELRRERQVVIQEIGQAVDTPDDIVFDHWQQAAYPSQPLGLPVLGTPGTVEALSTDQVRGFRDAFYTVDNVVVAAAGNVDHPELCSLAEKFADLGGTETEPRRPVAAYRGGDYREGRHLEQLHLVMGFEGVGFADPAYYAQSVLSTLLGGGMSSRLFQEVREKRGLAYSIHSFNSHYSDTGLFGIYAGTGPGDAAELIPAVCDEILGVLSKLPEEEVERAKAQLRASLLMGLESTANRCEQVGTQMLVFGRPVPPAEVVSHLAEVDAASIQAAATRMLAAPPTLAALGPLAGLEEYDRIAERLVA